MKSPIIMTCLFSLIFLAACGENDPTDEETPVRFAFAAPSILQDEEPYTLTVTVTGKGMDEMSAETTFVGKKASINFPALPSGPDRTFKVEVKNKNGEVLYRGTATRSLPPETPITVSVTLSVPHTMLDAGHSSKSEVLSISYSPDGRFLASGLDDQTIKIWDTKTFKEVRTLEGYPFGVNSVSYSPDGRFLASGSVSRKDTGDGAVKIWDAKTFKEVRTLDRGDRSGIRVNSLSYSPDGRFLASGGTWGDWPDWTTVRIWDLTTSKETITLCCGAEVYSVSYSPDGRFLAIGWGVWYGGSGAGGVQIWDVTTNEEVADLSGHASDVNSVSYSPDGRFLVSGSSDKTVKIWDMSFFEEVITLEGHASGVNSVSYSPDGRFLASGSSDETVKIWDLETFTEVFTLTGHKADVTSVRFSPDGRYLAGGSKDKTIRIWSATLWQ